MGDRKPAITMQIGKNGLTSEIIESIKFAFKERESIRVSVLKSALKERERIKETEEKILEKLGNKFTSRIIGFTIVLRKWKKAVR